MILKNKDKPNVSVYDKDKGAILFKFTDGEYDTDDEYIIKFWSNYLGGSSSTEAKIDEPIKQEDAPVKRRGRPKKG